MKATIRDAEKEEQEPTQIGPNYRIERFTSFSDLKPKYLDKEANLIEVNNWIRHSYISSR